MPLATGATRGLAAAQRGSTDSISALRGRAAQCRSDLTPSHRVRIRTYPTARRRPASAATAWASCVGYSLYAVSDASNCLRQVTITAESIRAVGRRRRAPQDPAARGLTAVTLDEAIASPPTLLKELLLTATDREPSGLAVAVRADPSRPGRSRGGWPKSVLASRSLRWSSPLPMRPRGTRAPWTGRAPRRHRPD
jgi:hypothetical protein